MTQVTTKQRVTADGRSLFEQFDAEDTGVATGAAYAAVLQIDCTRLNEGNIIIRNDGATNTIFYKVIASNKRIEPTSISDTSWMELKAETSIGTETNVNETWNGTYKWLWVVVKNNAGSSTVKAWARGIN